VFVDGGGGGASTTPTYSGPQQLKIEPSAIPTALSAFQEAHEAVSAKVRDLRGLDVREWAGDPVSGATAKRFNERTHGGGQSAIAALEGYQKQLESVIKTLEKTKADYTRLEGSNAALWGKYDA
jgi:hypothetical protein